MTCTASSGGSCTLIGICDNYDFLWNYSFGGEFGFNSNYFISPLGGYANTTADGNCELLIKYLDNENTIDSNYIILGTLWLSQFQVYGAEGTLNI